MLCPAGDVSYRHLVRGSSQYFADEFLGSSVSHASDNVKASMCWIRCAGGGKRPLARTISAGTLEGFTEVIILHH